MGGLRCSDRYENVINGKSTIFPVITISTNPSQNTPPCFSTKIFGRRPKKIGVLNQLKRSKNRFSAPLAPRKFGILEVSQNTPPCFSTVGNKGGVLARISTDVSIFDRKVEGKKGTARTCVPILF